MEVEWRDIPSLPGYQASSEGEIRGPDKVVRKLQKHKKDYPLLVVSYAAHRLVCEAFHGPPINGGLALHGPDHDKSNIKPDNLRWGSYQDNTDDCIASGRAVFLKGEEHGRAILTQALVDTARERWNTGEMIKPLWRELGEPLGIKYQAFFKAVKGTTWRHS